MMMFWLTAGALLLASVVALLLGLRRGIPAQPAAAQDLQVYRDQLAEVERDAARGTIAPEEAARLRLEVSRRILDADRAAGTTATGSVATRGATIAAGTVLIATSAAVWLYERIGAPGYPDMPLAARIAAADEARASRPSQAVAEADVPPHPAPDVEPEYQALMEKLRAAVAERPDDLRGQQLLAQNEARLGRFTAALTAQDTVIRLKGADATAEDHASRAELLIYAAGGYVSPEAEAALTEALKRDPKNGTARYYGGLMLLQTGRPDLAFPMWRDLLETSPADAPWVAPIQRDIAGLAAMAGVRYAPPGAAGAPGPDAAAMAAASEMSAEDRTAMIEGMVAQLNDRLASEGGSAEEWARLISSLGVLGQADRARAIYAEAQTKFTGKEAELDLLRAAAEQAGVAQ